MFFCSHSAGVSYEPLVQSRFRWGETIQPLGGDLLTATEEGAEKELLSEASLLNDKTLLAKDS